LEINEEIPLLGGVVQSTGVVRLPADSHKKRRHCEPQNGAAIHGFCGVSFMIFVPLLRRHVNLWMATRLTTLAMTDYHSIVRDITFDIP